MAKTTKRKLTLLLKYAVCGSKIAKNPLKKIEKPVNY